MPIKIAVKIVGLKVYVIFSQSIDLDLHPSSPLRLKRDDFLNLYYKSNNCYLLIYWWFITPSTPEGHLGVFHYFFKVQTLSQSNNTL